MQNCIIASSKPPRTARTGDGSLFGKACRTVIKKKTIHIKTTPYYFKAFNFLPVKL
ncbi:hypothetical protein Clocl_3340 [Acetivibrio clariflavus DSM 19732]|uniref:Uncharacterized protein n=1 Tax=Acetivibrio clariflavus (strain DSM 19732 / NBRC 101661 / EBR45) TaxID=720554 RepID=G8LXC1_ACECE|nr:hypothetical protein Clocl_3340 [Acetivibrio clariflavus DSM 19732]